MGADPSGISVKVCHGKPDSETEGFDLLVMKFGCAKHVTASWVNASDVRRPDHYPSRICPEGH